MQSPIDINVHIENLMIPESDDLSGDLSLTSSPGELLREARIAAGLSQDEAAKELYMTSSRVRALESDDYKTINSTTFVRGYLRAYANLVRINAEVVVSAYEAHLKATKALTSEPLVSTATPTKSSWYFIAIVTACLAVLWLVSIWFFDNRPKPEYVLPASIVSPLNRLEKEPMLVNSDIVNVPTPSVPLGLDGEAAANVAVKTEAGAPEKLDEAAEQQAATATDTEVSALNVNPEIAAKRQDGAAVSGLLDAIALTFSDECWLEVSDSRGDVLATDLQAAGSSLTLRGVAPFKVKLGNAQSASILLNRVPVAIIPPAGTNVLEMQVGAE
jgi:cytoskeleton protein RodZ